MAAPKLVVARENFVTEVGGKEVLVHMGKVFKAGDKLVKSTHSASACGSRAGPGPSKSERMPEPSGVRSPPCACSVRTNERAAPLNGRRWAGSPGGCLDLSWSYFRSLRGMDRSRRLRIPEEAYARPRERERKRGLTLPDEAKLSPYCRVTESAATTESRPKAAREFVAESTV